MEILLHRLYNNHLYLSRHCSPPQPKACAAAASERTDQINHTTLQRYLSVHLSCTSYAELHISALFSDPLMFSVLLLVSSLMYPLSFALFCLGFKCLGLKAVSCYFSFFFFFFFRFWCLLSVKQTNQQITNKNI